MNFFLKITYTDSLATLIITRTMQSCTWNKDWLQQEHSYDRRMFSHDPLPPQCLSAVLHHTWSSAAGEYYKHGRGPFHWWLGLREELRSVFVKTDLVLQSKIETLTENTQQQQKASKKFIHVVKTHAWPRIITNWYPILPQHHPSTASQILSRESKYTKIRQYFFLPFSQRKCQLPSNYKVYAPINHKVYSH